MPDGNRFPFFVYLFSSRILFFSECDAVHIVFETIRERWRDRRGWRIKKVTVIGITVSIWLYRRRLLARTNFTLLKSFSQDRVTLSPHILFSSAVLRFVLVRAAGGLQQKIQFEWGQTPRIISISHHYCFDARIRCQSIGARCRKRGVIKNFARKYLKLFAPHLPVDLPPQTLFVKYISWIGKMAEGRQHFNFSLFLYFSLLCLISGVRTNFGENLSSQGSKQKSLHATRIVRYNNRKDWRKISTGEWM